MKKVAILTINDNLNYGNRLQNYAVQEVLKKNGVKSETINNQKGKYGVYFYIQKLKDIVKKIVKKDNITKRYLNFTKFNKNIKYSKYKIDENHIPKNLYNKYDCFVTGSDQVWNPSFERGSKIDLLAFVPPEKRNSFSASFGVNDLPEECTEKFQKELKKFKNISVREDRGKEIINDLTGREDVEVLLDPTMLLDVDEWDKVVRKPKNFNIDKYILTYFLGDMSEYRKNEINKFAEENGCKVINIMDKNSPYHQLGPSEFLYLEKNAFLICTDSFHSCVFAILFSRPFIVFDREGTVPKMNSRLETLLKKFKLEDRWFKEKITDDSLKVDYDETNRILEKEREKAKKFIEKL